MTGERLAAHRLGVVVPPGWDARIGSADGAATLHAGSFPLPAQDGEFGTRATAAMPLESVFLALTEYLPDRHLHPGAGLFAGVRPARLELRHFDPRALLLARPGQRGAQWFFSDAGRAFCLYAVLDARRGAGRLLDLASTCLRSLEIGSRP
jgi:hypothetical protein